MIRQCGILFSAIIGIAIVAQPAVADDQKTATTIARWEQSGNDQHLVFDVSDLLTPAQRDIVNSGFSTFTVFAISDVKIDESETLPEMRVVCSVKYDTWEERYQMIRVDPAPVESLVVKDYKDWASHCLRYELRKTDLLSRFKKGGNLNAVLQIRQSSPDEASKIKKWLVRQQSGFMQGLYAHMLGDFQFRGSIRINIQIPTLKNSEKKESRDPHPPVKKGP